MRVAAKNVQVQSVAASVRLAKVRMKDEPNKLLDGRESRGLSGLKYMMDD
jgi:hypothetical protein